jgi:hypothetical protein
VGVYFTGKDGAVRESLAGQHDTLRSEQFLLHLGLVAGIIANMLDLAT